jgi:dolichyl-phosphate-mannose--protein O-mannosyl transferase
MFCNTHCCISHVILWLFIFEILCIQCFSTVFAKLQKCTDTASNLFLHDILKACIYTSKYVLFLAVTFVTVFCCYSLYSPLHFNSLKDASLQRPLHTLLELQRRLQFRIVSIATPLLIIPALALRLLKTRETNDATLFCPQLLLMRLCTLQALSLERMSRNWEKSCAR